MNVELLLAILGLLMLSFGVGSWWAGRRGRRVDDHPVCRKCGFDQTGRPESSTRCAECGADLTAPGAVRIGNRARQTTMIRAGLAAVLLGLVVMTWTGVRIARQFDPMPWLPLRWVLDDADKGGAQTRQAALGELDRRLSKLPRDSQIVLVDRILKVHADPKANWAGWDRLLNDCVAHGFLQSRDFERLLRNSLKITFELKPRLRREQLGTVHYGVQPWRLDVRSLQVTGGWSTGPLLIGGREAHRALASAEFDSPSHNVHGSSTVASFQLDKKKFADLPDGKYEATVKLHVDVTVIAPVSAGPIVFDVESKLPVELYPADATVDTFAADSERRETVRASIEQVRLAAKPDGRVLLLIQTNAPPVPLAMEATLVRGDQRQRIGTLLVPAGSSPARREVSNTPTPIFNDGQVDIVLTPSQSAADHQYALDTYWGEPIVITGVTVNEPYDVPFNRDESLRAAVEQSVKVKQIDLSGPAERPWLSFGINFTSPPVKLAYQIFLRIDGREQKIDTHNVVVPAGQNYGYGGMRRNWPVAIPDSVTTADIVLRPDAQWEGRSSDLTPPWAGEVAVRGIKLVRETPATQQQKAQP